MNFLKNMIKKIWLWILNPISVWNRSLFPKGYGWINLLVIIVIYFVIINSLFESTVFHFFSELNILNSAHWMDGWHTKDIRNFHKFFTFLLDPFFAVVTGIIGYVIWYNQNLKRNIEELPKRMTVHYILNNKKNNKKEIIASCYEAALAHEGDIRNWSQQIGRQILGENFKMYPYFNIAKPKVVDSEIETVDRRFKKLGTKPLSIRLYEVEIFLNADCAENILEKNKKYSRKNTIIWSENTPTTPMNEEYEYIDGFVEFDKKMSLLEIKSSSSKFIKNPDSNREVINNEIIDIKIDSQIYKIQNLNRRINDLIESEDNLAIEFLKTNKAKEVEILKKLIDKNQS